MNAAFPARLPFEVLHNVRDIDLRAIDAGFVESAIEKLSSRTNKGSSLEVFAISWLLANEHDRRAGTPFTEYRLCSGLPERARSAAGGNGSQLRQRWSRRDQRGRGFQAFSHGNVAKQSPRQPIIERMLNRRQFVKVAGVAALAPGACVSNRGDVDPGLRERAPVARLVNDIHSQLN